MKDVLRCLLLKTGEKKWLLPYAACAEVVSINKVKQSTKQSEWWLGEFEWRGLEIPLIDLEKLASDFESGNKSKIDNIDNKGPNSEKNTENVSDIIQIAVLNRISEQGAFDFIGISLQTIPLMLRVRSPDLKDAEKQSEKNISSYSIKAVLFREELVLIPDLLKINLEISRQ